MKQTDVDKIALGERAQRRLEKLLENTYVERYPLCIERARLITESWEQTKDEPMILRLAKAFAHLVKNMTVFIDDGELIVGNGASKPMGLEIEPFMGPFSEENLRTLEEEGFISVDDADWPEIKELASYWQDKNLQYRIGQLLDDKRLWPFAQTGVLLPPFRSKEEGIGGWAHAGIGMGVNRWLGVVDFEKVLNHGLNRLIKEAEEELAGIRFTDTIDTVRKAHFLQAVIISLKGIIQLANRFADLAAELALKETDRVRKAELQRIAEICKRVPANSARTFYEAMQSFWFTFLVVQQGTASAGRFDQYMYPFYQRDIDKGETSEAEVLELLQLLRIKDMHLMPTPLHGAKRQQYAGFAKWHNFTIGGVTPDGQDATNRLTYLILEAARRTRTPHHTITLRVHEGTPKELMIKALEVVKTGVGMPAFIGDKAYVEWLLSRGIPLELARDYVMAGCIEVSLPGHSRQPKCTFLVPPKILEIFMNNGVDPRTGLEIGPFKVNLEGFETFEDLVSAFKEYLAYFIHLAAELINVDIACAVDYASPIDSALMADAITQGKSLMERRMLYENGGAISLCGMINVVDSLAAIKKLVFDEKKITMTQLAEALRANWKGYDELRSLCLAAPKYGNDDDYVDSIAADLYRFYAETVPTVKTVYGEKFIPVAISITSQWAGGTITGATPDGRRDGEVLADGGASPMRGRDINGPTAIIKSASKIDQVRFQSVLLNMKFHPSALGSAEDLEKLATLIKTYFSLGGKHVQFNVASRETLLDAQKHPENYRDLVVRVAGFSAYFVQLSKQVQDEIIARTELNI
jgi:pyruvate formate-lyase/glycerol dehydratase family glycyl radical enzyme